MRSFQGRWRDVPIPKHLSGASYNSSVLFGPEASRARPQELQLDARPDELKEWHKEAIRQLDRLEEDRDLATQAARHWQERLAEREVEYARLQEQLHEMQERAAEADRQDEELQIQLPSRRQALLDLQQQLQVVQKSNQAFEAAFRSAVHEHERLQHFCEKLELAKRGLEEELDAVGIPSRSSMEELCEVQEEAQELQRALEQVQTDSNMQVEELETRLRQSQQHNVELLQRFQHNEVQEHRTVKTLGNVNQLMSELAMQRKELRKQLQGRRCEHPEREVLEDGVASLRESIHNVAQHNLQIQDDGRSGVSDFSDLGDNIFALEDQIRKVRFKLDQQVQKGKKKGEKLRAYEMQSMAWQRDLEAAVEDRLAADSHARNSTALLAILQGKHERLSKCLELQLKGQDMAERRLQQLLAKVDALEVHAEDMRIRLDGNEEDVSALRYHLRKTEDGLWEAKRSNIDLLQRHRQESLKQEELETERASIRDEIAFIRREDMLDEFGRTQPILIESESPLLERLEINDFLMSAQRTRRPVPLLCGKIAHLVELLINAHKEDSRLGEYVEDAGQRRGKLSKKHRALRRVVTDFEAWKSKLLTHIITTELQGRNRVTMGKMGGHTLYLESMGLQTRHLQDTPILLRDFGKQNDVTEVRLQDNQLDRTSLPVLCELMDMCSKLQYLDLRRNALDQHSVAKLTEFADRISGDKLSIRTEEQGVPDLDMVDDNLSESDSDEASRPQSPEPDSPLTSPDSQKLPLLSGHGSGFTGKRSPSMASDSTLSMRTGQTWKSVSDLTSPSSMAASRSPSIASNSTTSLPSSPQVWGTRSRPSTPSRYAGKSLQLPAAVPERSSKRFSPSSSQSSFSPGQPLTRTLLPSPGPSRPSSGSLQERSPGGFDWAQLAEDTARMLKGKPLGKSDSTISLPQISGAIYSEISEPHTAGPSSLQSGDIEM